MGILAKFIKPKAELPEHVIDGTSLRSDWQLSHALKHWLAGGSIEMQMDDGTWVVNNTPSFSAGVQYRPAFGSVNLYDDLLSNVLKQGKDSVAPRISQLTVDVDREREKSGTLNRSMQSLREDLQTANQTIADLRGQLNAALTAPVAVAPVAGAPAPAPAPQIHWPASSFTAGCKYTSRDGRGFEVVADKASIFKDFGKAYNPLNDPDKKQLVVIRSGDKKPATFACRTVAGYKVDATAPSNLDLTQVYSAGSMTLTPHYSVDNQYIIVAKRKHATNPLIALCVKTGEAVALKNTEQR